MALKPEASIGTALAVSAVVYAIHSNATPTQADIRVGSPNDETIDKSERAATIASIGVVAGISLIAKDPTVFIIGGAAAVFLAWWTRYNNAINPLIGKPSMENASIKAVPATAPDDSDDYGAFADVA